MKPALSTAIVCALAALLSAACPDVGTVTGPRAGEVPDPDPDPPDEGPDASVPDDDQADAATADPPDAATSHDPPDAAPAPIDAHVPPPPVDARVPDAALPPPTGPDCTDAAHWPAAWTALEDEVLVLVNQRRAAGATCGGVSKPPVPALVMDAKLRQAARCHSLDMAQHNYFSHDSQDGRSPWDRIRDAGYTGFGNAENIAAGQGTAAAVMSSWMTSTGHCNNIMSGNANEIGIGYALDTSSDLDRYWTQDFGKR
jgi:uncharacterized protein YkwD